MTGDSHQPKGEWAADLACVCLVNFLGILLIDAPADGAIPGLAALLWSFTCPAWMVFGTRLLKEVEWKRSYGAAGGLTWLLKDALAMVLWPVLLKWILNSRKSQS